MDLESLALGELLELGNKEYEGTKDDLGFQKDWLDEGQGYWPDQGCRKGNKTCFIFFYLKCKECVSCARALLVLYTLSRLIFSQPPKEVWSLSPFHKGGDKYGEGECLAVGSQLMRGGDGGSRGSCSLPAPSSLRGVWNMLRWG